MKKLKIDNKTLENLLNHIVLPPYLPQKRSPNFADEELELLKRMINNIKDLLEFIPLNTLEMMQSLDEIHSKPHANTIKNKLFHLKPGQTFAMFIRSQNCVLMIHMLSNGPADSETVPIASTDSENIIIATFPGKLHPKEVYSNPSDLEFNYPSEAIKVKCPKILHSKEFAKMLLHLHENKLVDSHISDYVSKWLVTVLMSENCSTAVKFPLIKKKIRDEILDTPTEYVRRSSFYMVMKVLLQHNLTLEIGESKGKLLYKIIMLKFITDQCNIFKQSFHKFNNVELATQLMAKLARRIEKLSTNENNDYEIYKDLKKEIIQNACSVISKMRIKIGMQIDQLQFSYEKQSQLLPLIDLDFEIDIFQRVPRLCTYLKYRSDKTIQNYAKSNTLNAKTYDRFHINRENDSHRFLFEVWLRAYFGHEEQRKSEIKWNLLISDLENCILYGDYFVYDERAKTKQFTSEFFFEKILVPKIVFKSYVQTAGDFYTDDQIGHSKMVLVLLKIIAILDKKVTSMHPILLEHRSGINPKIIESLLLPQFTDMQIAYELEMYFYERNTKAIYPSLIEESTIGNKSFAARFGATDSRMQSILREIQNEDEINIASKKREWSQKREELANLESKLSNLTDHEYCMVSKQEKQHDPKCQLCSITKQIEIMKKCGGNIKKLQKSGSKLTCKFNIITIEEEVHSKHCELCFIRRQIKNMKIWDYVRLLPNEVYQQNAVVFELNIPKEVASLRDTLHSFAKYVTGLRGEFLEIYANRELNKKLAKYIAVSEDGKLNRKRMKSMSYDIRFGSTMISETCEKSVPCHFDFVIIDNNFDCTYYSKYIDDYDDDDASFRTRLITEMPDKSIKARCTLSVEKNSKYEWLQRTLEGTLHTENMVLAGQSECKQDMSLAEFKNFGTLRADGHRLQWHKLYAMIETDALSFENGSVLSLVMQTIWETGIIGNAGIIRESHEDLKCKKFSRAMIELLNKFVDQKKNNWAHPLKLLMAVLIVVRVFEMNNDEPNFAEQIVKLLNKIRTIVLDWIERIQKAIQNMQHHDQKNQNEMRLNLIFVAIAGAMTFNIHCRHKFFDKIFMKDETNGFTAPRIWLQFIVTISNSLILNQQNNVLNLRLLLRMVRNIGIQIESTLQTIIENNPSDIYNFIEKMWARSKNGNFIKLNFNPDCRQRITVYIQVKSRDMYVTIDLITGLFLVNNLPIRRLPNTITEDTLFKSIFENVVFDVQPDAKNSFFTIHKYNGNNYEFTKTNDGVNIIEHRENGTEYELIPAEIFIDEISPLLIQDYSHWWSKSLQKIEFRSNSQKKRFSTEVEYELDLNRKYLQQKKTGRNMLDITSKSYQMIVNQFSRLEQSKYIHVLMDAPKIAKIELIRMQLKFIINCSVHQNIGYDILSNEFSNMRISLQQNCGTLYGLNHGLFLESDNNSSKLLLLPHGKISANRNNLHMSVNINIESDELNTPLWHSYQVDEICKQLKPTSDSHSAWFFIAYLHAVTSYGEIEPFTGISGTERALQILQSNVVWSSAPYDLEANEMLNKFKNLTPCRRLNGTMMQVDWPSFIHSHSAQDSYIFIVNKLLADSERFKELYQSNETSTIKINSHNETELNLNARSYFNSLTLMPQMKISNQYLNNFLQHENGKTNFPSSTFNKTSNVTSSKHTQTVAILYNKNQYCVPTDLNSRLRAFLLENNKELPETNFYDDLENVLTNIREMRDNLSYFRDRWLSFYDLARQSQNYVKFELILTLLAHHGNNIDAILTLQAINKNRPAFRNIDPPNVATFFPSEGTYNEMKISMIFKDFHKKPTKYKKFQDDERKKYDREISNNISKLTKVVTEAWPCATISLHEYSHYANNIDISSANRKINLLLTKWHNNYRLDIFIDQLAEKLNSLSTSTTISCPKINPNVQLPSKNWPRYQINWKLKLSQNLDKYKDIIEEAQSVWKMKDKNETSKSATYWWFIYNKIVSENAKHLIDAGIFPRLVPTLILPKLIFNENDNRLKVIIGAWAISLSKEQRQIRISTYSQQSQMKSTLEREIENKPHENWSPCEYPEWLIFEIEQNLTIRRVQVEIAKRMIDNDEDNKQSKMGIKHFTMQLNMGEGKTAVIVPILASVLANGKQICQITVLKSLFVTNLKSLRQYLGGMLGRKVYTFPCRRDLPINKYLKQIMEMYKECGQNKGVILTLPEYRLSFQLKIYESVAKNEIDFAQQLLAIHRWINQNVRNILDESDAILHAKYQLIYTVGNQIQIDSGSHRWLVIQALLKRVPYHMKRLYDAYGEKHVEFNMKKGNYRNDVFTRCRILDEKIFSLLKKEIIEDFLNGRTEIMFPDMATSDKTWLRILLSEKQIDKQQGFETMLHKFDIMERNTVLILVGLLRFEVLKLILTKRWRVNYGVDERSTRKMAVPFKAKDVAVEMTEFGHPDVAICFTQLCYYYSGLSDDQLMQTFQLLAMTQNADTIYQKWINGIDSSLVDSTIQAHTGINLIDSCQRDEILFPLFRFNMHIIDFWLSNVVFLHEAKTFEYKLMCTAWDLCSDHLKYRVTGFSGTNDTKNILPMTVAQNDLKELLNTNENVRKTLLQPENQRYENLPANGSAQDILQQLTKHKIPVLIDSGALMLELNNKQVAEIWLNLTSEIEQIGCEPIEAAVYFDTHDILQTIDRNGVMTEFDSSVYRENLNRCLVYLDDSHTRGTDLKFPLNWTACVTLSGDITRDKTVQACMRMRQCGNGHSIAFWASFEADLRIREICKLSLNDRITNENVIQFICHNSCKHEMENIVHWTAAAYNYTKKLAAHKLYENLPQKLYEKCIDKEFVTLMEMYGQKKDILLSEISKNNFKKLTNTCGNLDFIQSIKNGVEKKLKIQAKDIRCFASNLDEQQEKEVEMEHENEKVHQIKRPPPVEPAIPMFDNRLIHLIQNGLNEETVNDLRFRPPFDSLNSVLVKTQLFKPYKDHTSPWSNNLYVTNDFARVLNDDGCKKCDEFLRPVWWIACVYGEYDAISVLMSSNEVNHLLPYFRKSSNAALLMFRPKLSKSHNDFMNERSLQVTGIDNNINIHVNHAIQIKMFSGSMYFNSENEQNTYCNFLGLIPRPRTKELEIAFENGFIEPNGYVPFEHRHHSTIANCVNQCKFKRSPIGLAIKLIEAHHGLLQKESHVAAILERSVKLIEQ